MKGKVANLDDPNAWRMVNDLREINKRTKVVSNPLPRIEDVIDRVAGSRYFTAFDLASSFWQVRYRGRDGSKFCFVTEDGTYEPTGMLMGAVNSAEPMQAFMVDTLKEFVGVCVEIYIDDILVHSMSEEQHKVDVERVLAALVAKGWTLREEKCIWCATEIDYLGHRLMGNGVVIPKDGNVKQIIEHPTIESAAELREFLGKVATTDDLYQASPTLPHLCTPR
jgi:hypothetical protein